MPGLGLVMLLLVGLGIVFTGLPAAVVLIGVATFGATFSVLAGLVLAQAIIDIARPRTGAADA